MPQGLGKGTERRVRAVLGGDVGGQGAAAMGEQLPAVGAGLGGDVGGQRAIAPGQRPPERLGVQREVGKEQGTSVGGDGHGGRGVVAAEGGESVEAAAAAAGGATPPLGGSL